jgi:lysozyme family protein
MPFVLDDIAAENRQLLARVKYTAICPVARRAAMTANFQAYDSVANATGVPIALIAALNERESSSSLRTYLGNGDPLNKTTKDVPRGRGPFIGPDAWERGALDAFHLDGLDKYPPGKWDLAFALAVAEHYNGYGYRQRGLRSPYVWGGTDLYTKGRYVADGEFSASSVDHSPGCALLIKSLADVGNVWRISGGVPSVTTAPLPAPTALAGHPQGGVAWVQNALNLLIHAGLAVDGSYGARTRAAVREFQHLHGLMQDGIAGPLTLAAMTANIAPALSAAAALTPPSTPEGIQS